MLAGCRAWQDPGLQPPKKVRDAVTSYFDTEDFVSDWIAEDCEVAETHVATAADLYGSWRRRAELLGIDPGNARDWPATRGCRLQDGPHQQARGWKGLRPLPADDGEGSR